MGRYFYFRFVDTFFEEQTISHMKHIPVYGYQFIVIYLELCARSVKNEGILQVPKYGDMPWMAILAQWIGEELKITTIAFEYFLKTGLIKQIEEEEVIHIKIPLVENYTGKSSAHADKIRLGYQEKEKRLPGGEKRYASYGLLKHVKLTREEYQELIAAIPNADQIIEDVDTKKAMGKSYAESDFEVIKMIAEKEEKKK